MYTRALTLLFLIWISLSIPACRQDMPVHPDQSKTFIKLYGGFNTEKAYASALTADGGFVCMGSTNSFGAGGLDVFILKTDKAGNKEWEQTLGGTSDDEGKALQVLADGSLLCLGDYTMEDGHTDLYLSKLSSSGDLIWSKTIGFAGRSEKAFDLKITTAGEFLLIGNTQAAGTTTDMYLVKTDAAGNIKWQRNYGLTELQDEISAVEETAEGNLVWCGSEFRQRTGNIAPDMRVILTNGQGDILWDKNLGKQSMAKGADIALTGTSYIALGTTYTSQDSEADIFLTCLFENSTIRWQQIIEKPKSSEEATSISATRDGGYIITGSTAAAGTGNQDILLLKVDKYGKEIWSKSFGGQLPDTGVQVNQTSDGGYIIFGTVYFETNPMLCLIKTDAEGELNTK